MKPIIPDKLHKGDTVCVIAPSLSMAIIGKEVREIARERFQKLGLTVIFGNHVEEKDAFLSSSISSRIDDLHAAFTNKNVKAIFSIIGGFNSNQLLESINWDLIRKNPKILCGFSDITILNNSIFAKTGLITYSGPHYSTFGQKEYFDYTLEYVKKCLMSSAPYEILPSNIWTDDEWFKDQDKRDVQAGEGYWSFNNGKTEGTIIGGNLGTFNLLQGTPYIPDIRNTILFLEDDLGSNPREFDRYIQSLIQQPKFSLVRGLVIGKFQKASAVTKDLLKESIATKKALMKIPVVANVNFGHTDPKITFPIGGSVKLNVGRQKTTITIIDH